MIGKSVSHYKILEKLGAGGMGVVYKAEDTRLKRIVALKFLPASFTNDKEAKLRFIHEAQSASALDHANICTIYEIGETEDGQLFIAMAYYEGETLDEKLKKGIPDIKEALQLMRQICEGLNKAHLQGIVHRDIKPANIFITKDGIVKILDFGLAKSSGRAQLTQLGTTVGTCRYMSPEQAKGGEVDQRTDIWAAGIVLFEMLTGNTPFNADYDQAVIYAILNEEPDFNSIRSEIIRILKKTLEKSPDKRYQKINELSADLGAVENNKTGFNHSSYDAVHSRKFISRSRIIAGVFAAILTVIILLYYFIFNEKQNANIDSAFNKKMIVVLPFENLGSADDDYFAEGVREEISNKLSSLSSLGVISRHSAEAYSHSKKSISEIGKELGVDYILEGTIQWAKNGRSNESRIRIIPQLIRVSDDISIWSESYDRVLTDIFTIQSEIAQNIVEKLGIKILPGQTVTGPPPTKNLEAYDYYLKAYKFHYGPSTGANIKTAIKLYEQAIRLDSNYAEVHAQLSIAYNGLFKWYWDRDSINLKKAADHLEKAVRLNPNIAEVHLARFFYYYWFTDNAGAVFDELKKTLEIQPNNAEANFMIGPWYNKRGEHELSRQCDMKAMQLDPLNARYPWGIGLNYFERRDYSSAEKYLKKAIELSPNSGEFYVALAKLYLSWKGDLKLVEETLSNVKNDEYLETLKNYPIYFTILKRDFNKAIEQLKNSEKEYENQAKSYIPNSEMIGLVYRYMGQAELSRKYIDSAVTRISKMISLQPDEYRLPLSLSICYAALGEKEKAFRENSKAIGMIVYVNNDFINFVRQKNLAMIYSLTGDYSNSIKSIDSLLSFPCDFSLNELKLDPIFDPLRKLPDYKKLIEKYSSD